MGQRVPSSLSPNGHALTYTSLLSSSRPRTTRCEKGRGKGGGRREDWMPDLSYEVNINLSHPWRLVVINPNNRTGRRGGEEERGKKPGAVSPRDL